MRAVEYSDHSTLRNALMDAPEEVMLVFEFARDLEAGDLATHWVDATEYLLDRPVLARRIAALEDDENGVTSIRVQRRLQFPDSLALVLGGVLEVVALGEAARARSVGVADADLSRAGYRDELSRVVGHASTYDG